MDNIEEKISALYDGELSDTEANEVLLMIENDIDLQNKLSKYALMTAAMKQQKNNVQLISSSRSDRKFNFWISNSITAAATVLITFFVINQFDLNRMGEDISAKNQINIAVNSKEAKDTASRAEENLVDHIMQVINNQQNDNTTLYNVDLRNVGFTRNSPNSRTYNKGNKNFVLHIEKKNLGIKKVRNWQHKDKMIYVVPMQDGRVLTLYGNIDQKSALEIANTINIK
jgi:hypothetical protein|tara:strand:+ start:7 stop:690 length:684 start_codon:yes stop_codon:yes gene_type:complete